MSQVKLTLRPPPNVDFVHGYPGIPASTPDSQATVKGAIEVRTPPTGVKAKWVRVELRKVETLPGGGTSNTFSDFVGSSPITLWTASDEFTLLRSHDFQFMIRIPESIPPSLMLENKGAGAGVRYELVASVCTKGKSGFLRRNKSNVVSTAAPIIIDKHELHSTWPVYCQPETRQISQNGVTLTVDRNHNCYGPGDRITVIATLKSDSLHTITLRGFEVTVRESTIFRTSPYTSGAGGKKTVPQAKVISVAESKYPVNLELYGGTTKTQELTCHINPDHTTATLNAARHIDITYVLSVKALMGTGTLTPLNMDLPIILSNWPKSVSEEAVRRIGPAPSLSLLPPGSSPTASASPPNISQSYAGRPSSSDLSFRPPVAQTYQGNGFPAAATIKADEFGRTPASAMDRERDRDRKQRTPGTGQDAAAAAPVDVTPAAVAPSATRRPNSGVSDVHQQSRFTIVNALPNELPAAESKRKTSGTGRVWPSAGDEKERLFETAKAKVEKTQDMAARSLTPPIEQPKPRPSSSKRWLTAEEEKARLYNQAQEAVKRTQDIVDYPEASGSSSTPKPAKVDSPPRVTPVTSGRTFSSAQQEKEAMRLYHEATDRVNRAVNSGSPPLQDAGALVVGLGGPVAYDSLYPTAVQSASPPPIIHAPQPSASDFPPPFDLGTPRNAKEQLDEKERLRREYERRDAEELARQQQQSQEVASSSMVPPYDPPPFSAGPSAAAVGEAISEKEALRRRFEQQDREAMAARGGFTTSPSPPSRHASATSVMSRPPPNPPIGPGGFKPLTAVEEKAMLKARYDAENAASSSGSYPQPASPPPPTHNRNGSGRNGMSTPPLSYSPSPKSSIPAPDTPPPLRPRPPASYIAETQAEDARVSKYTMSGAFVIDDDTGHINVNGSKFKVPGPPPPLPPKPADEA